MPERVGGGWRATQGATLGVVAGTGGWSGPLPEHVAKPAGKGWPVLATHAPSSMAVL